MRIGLLANCLAFLAIVATASAQAPAEIVLVGSSEELKETTPFDVSDDGVVVGQTFVRKGFENTPPQAFRWDGQMQFVGLPAEKNAHPFGIAATGITDDSRVIVGRTSIDGSPRSYRIVGDEVPIELEGIYPSNGALGMGQVLVSGDGRVLVGGTVRRVDDGPIQKLGTLAKGRPSLALAASFDGGVIVGVAKTDENQERAFRWTAETGMVDLGVLDGARPASKATAVSGDGSVVIGTSETDGRSGGRNLPFVWTAEEGMTMLPEFENRTNGEYFVETISGDGRIIGGAVSFGDMPIALLWIDRKPIALATLLENEGVDLSMWEKLNTVEAVSSNGTYVTGYGSYYGKPGPGGWRIPGRTGYRAKIRPLKPNPAQTPAGIGLVGSPDEVRETTPFDVSDDGVVVGRTFVGLSKPPKAFRWDGQMRFLGAPPEGLPISETSAAATGISDYGRLIVGHTSIDGVPKPYKIVGDGAPIDLEGIRPSPGIAGYGFVIVSGDGRVVVDGQGSGGGGPFRVVDDGTIQALGTLAQGRPSEALATSFDGSVIVGVGKTEENKERAFRWTAKTGMVDLGLLDGERVAGKATAVSGDGSVVAGTAETDGRFGSRSIPFLWTAQEGMTKLPELENRREGNYSVETVSGDGRIIGGSESESSTALLWIDRKPVELATLLKNEGVDLSMWEELQTVEAVSSNGLYVTGYGSYYGKPGPGGWRIPGRTGYLAKSPPLKPDDEKRAPSQD